MKVLLASNNAHKLGEVRRIFAGRAEVLSPADAGCEIDVVEDGSTFEENARKKALAFARASGMTALADDSGLEVYALGGAPGVHSARYAGEGHDAGRNNEKLLEALRDVADEDRTARFRCAVACARGKEILFVVSGSVEGRITVEPRGAGGFGYDPLFFYEEYGKTFAECASEEKNAVSHRGRAFRKALEELEKTGRMESTAGK